MTINQDQNISENSGPSKNMEINNITNQHENISENNDPSENIEINNAMNQNQHEESNSIHNYFSCMVLFGYTVKKKELYETSKKGLVDDKKLTNVFIVSKKV